MVRRRVLLRALVGGTGAAVLGAVCGAPTGLPKASVRRYRIGALIQRVAQCEHAGEYVVADGAAVKTVQTRPVNSDFCFIEGLMLEALEKRGYRQGENLEWIVASPADYLATGVADFIAPAKALQAIRVDIIGTSNSNSTAAAAQITTTTPIVLASSNDILDTGLVASLAHPGGNITGISGRLVDITAKRFELLKETFPWVKSPILVYGNFAPHLRNLEAALEAGRRLGLSAVAILVTGDGTDFMAKAKRTLDDGSDSLVAMGTPGPPEQIVPIVKERRVPAIFGTEFGFLEAGAPVGYGTSLDAPTFAEYADRIFKGANPGDLPIVAPKSFELVVNLKAAEALGFTIAPSVLARATRLIK